MLFTSTQKNLAQGLFYVSGITGNNLPITHNTYLEIKDGTLQLKTTDLNLAIKTLVPGKAETDGVFTVETKFFTNFINLLPAANVTLEKKENQLNLTCGGHQTSLNGLSAEDFPVIPEVSRDVELVLSCEALKQALNLTSFAVSKDISRPELNGVLVEVVESTLYFVSTDSYRLAEKKIVLKNKPEIDDLKFTLPEKTVRELIRILPDNGDVSIFITNDQVLFVFAEVEVVSQLVSGQFPDYKQIIPENTKTEFLINREEFLQSVKTAGLFAQVSNNSVKIISDVEKQTLGLVASSSKLGRGEVNISAKVDGDVNSIIFDYRYLLDGLQNLEGEQVKLEITNATIPSLLTSSSDPTYLYLLMPIKSA